MDPLGMAGPCGIPMSSAVSLFLGIPAAERLNRCDNQDDVD